MYLHPNIRVRVRLLNAYLDNSVYAIIEDLFLVRNLFEIGMKNAVKNFYELSLR